MIGSSGASYTSYNIMKFDKASYTVQDVAVHDGDKYYVEGKESSEEEYLKYREDFLVDKSFLTSIIIIELNISNR